VNRRTTPPVANTLTAAATLALSACGGTGSSSGKDTLTGAEAPSSTSAPSSTPTSAGTDRPAIVLPSDLSYSFDWPKTGDKNKDLVLADSEQSIKAVDLAIVNQNALDKAYLYYYEGEAAVGTQKCIQNYVDHKAGITGVYRFYDPQVAVDRDGTASLSYCEDQGKAYAKYLPNKVKKTEVTSDSYVMYHTSLKKDDKGVWVIREINSQIGSTKCQP
jgi:hypothetical protein